MSNTTPRKVALKWVLGLRSGTSCDERVNDGAFPVMGASGVIGWTNKANTKAGSVIIGRVGTVGAVNRVQADCWASDNSIVATPGPNLDPAFTFYLLLAARLPELASKTAQPLLTASSIGSQRFLIPDLAQQRRIADFLDTETTRIDCLAAAMTSQDALLKQRRLRLLDLARGENTEHSNTVRLGYFTTLVTSGSRGWGEFTSDSGELFFRSANLHPDRIHPKLTNTTYVRLPESQAADSRRARIRSGDCLIGITGANAGWVCLADESVADGYVSQHVCLVRPDPRRLNSHWLALLMASPSIQNDLMGSQYGGTKTQLSLPDVREIKIPVIPLHLQIELARSIDRRISVVDRQRALRRQQLSLLAERRQALITAAVTGRFDVSTASGRNVTEGVSV